MRRTDREVTDVPSILSILARCAVCRLALSQNDRPYIVPMNFGYEFADDKLTLWFHCAKEGKKLDILRANPSACFEIDMAHKLKEGFRPCEYGMSYESVIGFGRIVVCDNRGEKEKGLRMLMKKYAPDGDFSFTERQLESVAVLRLDVESFTGKRQT